MWQEIDTIWVAQQAISDMVKEADRTWPNETGGILLGYVSAPSEVIVVTKVIGPGAQAFHGPSRFVPDALYHEEAIRDHYQDSCRTEVYLGDWHTHPWSGSYLSRTDRHTLRAIAQHPEARISAPLMAVLGSGDPWKLSVWRYHPEGHSWKGLWKRPIALGVHIYDEQEHQ